MTRIYQTLVTGVNEIVSFQGIHRHKQDWCINKWIPILVKYHSGPMSHRGDLTYLRGRKRELGMDRTAFWAWANPRLAEVAWGVNRRGSVCWSLGFLNPSLLDWPDYKNQKPVKGSPRSPISLEWEDKASWKGCTETATMKGNCPKSCLASRARESVSQPT